MKDLLWLLFNKTGKIEYYIKYKNTKEEKWYDRRNEWNYITRNRLWRNK